MAFYAYHFMENHVHLIGRTETKEFFSEFFRVVHNLFARQFNRRVKRRGQVVMERLKSPTIDNDAGLLAVMAYVDLNGVRAGRDQRPEDSIWSSYHYYATGKPDDLISPAPSYLAISDDVLLQRAEYRTVVAGVMKGTV